MNEFQKAQEEDDLKSLKEAIPTWMNARVEPFVPPVDSDVKVPQWGKAVIVGDNEQEDDGGGGNSGQTVSFIAGEEQGSNFVPMLITVSGTAEEIP